MKLTRKLALTMMLAGGMAMATACKKEKPADPAPDTTPEDYTTVTLHFTKEGETTEFGKYTWTDADGWGKGADGTAEEITLDANSTYLVTTEMKNTLKNPNTDLTTKVNADSKHYQMFWARSGSINISTTDKDAASPPMTLGLKTKWVVGGPGLTDVTQQLQYQDKKDGKSSTGETKFKIVWRAIAIR